MPTGHARPPPRLDPRQLLPIEQRKASKLSAPIPWRPEKGAILAGDIHKVAERDAGYGPYPLVIVSPDKGGKRRVWHAFEATADVKALALQRGDHVVIECVAAKDFRIDVTRGEFRFR